MPVPTAKVAYLVSRFPATSETFVLRELSAVDADSRVELELLSLFPENDDAIHPDAAVWVERRKRPSAIEALRDSVWWLLRRPLRLAGSSLVALAGHAGSPSRLLRVLVTLPLAASHARRIREHRVDHVHAHFANYPALAAWLAMRLTGTPYSFTAHAHDIYADQSFLRRKVADAEAVVAISRFNERFLSPYGGGAETPVWVVHCGVDPARFQFRPRRIRPEGEVQALCVATLVEQKGHEVLLDALAAGGRALSRLRFALVGDGPLRAKLEAQAAELGLVEQVRFLGALAEPEVRRMLEGADLFVLPSVIARDGLMEGIPVVLMEALATGVPIVTTRLSGIPELIEDGVTGLLAEPGNPEDLARTLERAVAGAPLDERAGRRLVEREFDVNAEAQKLVTLFTAGVGSRLQPP